MKIVVGILILLVALGAAAPYIAGSRVEATLNHQVEQLNSVPFYEFSMSSYDKGYRNATAVISIGVDEEFLNAMMEDLEPELAAMPDALNEGILVTIDIQHGLLLTDHGFGLGWADLSTEINRANYPQLASMFDAIGRDQLLRVTTRVALDGSGWTETHMDDLDVQFDEEGSSISLLVSGFESHATFTKFGESLSQTGALDQLQLHLEDEWGSQMDLFASGSTWRSDMTLSEPIWLSLVDSQLTTERLSFYADGAELFAADEAYVEASIEEGSHPDTLTLTESFKVTRADVMGERIESAELTFSYVDISKALYIEYLETVLDAENLADPTALDSALENMSDAVVAALEYNPRFVLDRFTAVYGDGQFDMSASMGLDKDNLPTPIDLENPVLYASAFDGGLNISANESLIRTLMRYRVVAEMASLAPEQQMSDADIDLAVDQQLALFLPMFTQQGFIVQSGDTYSSDIEISDGVVSINGKLMPFPMF